MHSTHCKTKTSHWV